MNVKTKVIAQAPAGRSIVFVTEGVNRQTGKARFFVEVQHVAPYVVTWSAHDTEAAARKSANAAWARFAGKEEMICA